MNVVLQNVFRRRPGKDGLTEHRRRVRVAVEVAGLPVGEELVAVVHEEQRRIARHLGGGRRTAAGRRLARARPPEPFVLGVAPDLAAEQAIDPIADWDLEFDHASPAWRDWLLRQLGLGALEGVEALEHAVTH